MTARVNPYVAGMPVGNTPAFVGRQDILTWVLDRVSVDDGYSNILLYGQRRIGKTSILHHLKTWLPQHGEFHCVYFDLQHHAKSQLGRILDELSQEIVRSVGIPGIPADRRYSENGKIKEWFSNNFLPWVFKSAQFAKKKSTRLVILFDEFDVIADAEAREARNSQAEFFSYLQLLIESSEWRHRLRFTFVIGRNIADLTTIAGHLLKQALSKRVSTLDRADAENLMRSSESLDGLKWQPDAVEKAWSLTNGHAYLLQALCQATWYQLIGKDISRHSVPKQVTGTDIEQSISETIILAAGGLEWLWGGLPKGAMIIASVLAMQGNKSISIDDLLTLLQKHGVQLMMREFEEAPRLLEQWDLIKIDNGMCQFRVELLRIWIAQQKSLAKVQDELDNINPLAKSFYRTAEECYKADFLDEALEQLRKVLKVNPDHIGALELMADILIKRGVLDEAEQRLKQLHLTHADKARPRLAQLYLKQAEAQIDENEKLALYQKILEIQQNSEVEGLRRSILQAKADHARAAKNFDLAIEIYGKANLRGKVEETIRESHKQKLHDALEEIKEWKALRLYDRCLSRLHGLNEEIGDIRNFTEELKEVDDLVREVEYLRDLDETYQRARRAIENGDKQIATQCLLKVIAVEPNYRDAVELLFRLKTETDVDGIKADLINAKSDNERAASELLAMRNALKAANSKNFDSQRRFRAFILSICMLIFFMMIAFALWRPTGLRIQPAKLIFNQFGKQDEAIVRVESLLGERDIRQVKWRSDNANVAVVEDDVFGNKCIVKAVGGGSTRVVAYADGLETSLDVVVQIPFKLELEPNELTIKGEAKGGEAALTKGRIDAKLFDDNRKPWPSIVTVEWESLAPNLIAIKDGVVQCNDIGSNTSIKAKYQSLTATATVTCIGPESCWDWDGDSQVDNDQDGLANCDDPDCKNDEKAGCYLDEEAQHCPIGSTGVVFKPDDLAKLVIPDRKSTSSAITVPISGTVRNVALELDLEHKAASDLEILLRSPSRAVQIVGYRSAEGSRGFRRATFRDAPSVSKANRIKGGQQKPYSGWYTPDRPLSTLVGLPAKGQWKLIISDRDPNDSGELKAWRLMLCVKE